MHGDEDTFDYVLAEKLGMSVGRMREEMSNEEYVNWIALDTARRAWGQVRGG